MNPSTQAIDLLDEFIEDLIAGTPPRVYARIAAALGIAVEEVEEVLMLFAWAHYLAWWARAHRHRADGRENQSLQTEAVSAGSSDL
jgi:hypothetical protein